MTSIFLEINKDKVNNEIINNILEYKDTKKEITVYDGDIAYQFLTYEMYIYYKRKLIGIITKCDIKNIDIIYETEDTVIIQISIK